MENFVDAIFTSGFKMELKTLEKTSDLEMPRDNTHLRYTEPPLIMPLK